MLTFMESEAQLLLGGQLTPQAYDKAIQANWDKFITTGQ
jgi:hypothetical protein